MQEEGSSLPKAENQQEYLFALNRPSLGSQGQTGSFDHSQSGDGTDRQRELISEEGQLIYSENRKGFQPNHNLISFGKKMSQGSALLL